MILWINTVESLNIFVATKSYYMGLDGNWHMAYVSAVIICLWGQILHQYGLSSPKRLDILGGRSRVFEC